MTPFEIYEALNALGVEYDVVEILDGLRVISIEVEEDEEREP